MRPWRKPIEVRCVIPISKLSTTNDEGYVVQRESNSRPLGPGGDVPPGFYSPVFCEDGNPLEDEVKLHSFTRTLPGYEAGIRVPVNLTVNAVHDNVRSPLPTPTSNKLHDFGQHLPFRRLQVTRSDLKLRKPEWDKPRKPRKMPFGPLQARMPNSRLLQDTVFENSVSSFVEASPSTSRPINLYGAVGEGRSPASSQIRPSGSSLNKPYDQLEDDAGRSADHANLPSSNTVIHPNLRATPSPANIFSNHIRDSFVQELNPSETPSTIDPHLIWRSQRRGSWGGVNPTLSIDMSASVPKRICRPAIPTTLPFEPEDTDMVAQRLYNRTHLPLTSHVPDPIVSPVRKCGSHLLASNAPPSLRNGSQTAPRETSWRPRGEPELFELPLKASNTQPINSAFHFS